MIIHMRCALPFVQVYCRLVSNVVSGLLTSHRPCSLHPAWNHHYIENAYERTAKTDSLECRLDIFVPFTQSS